MAQARSVSRGSADAGRAACIGASARVRGRVAGEGDLTVEGRVEGDVSLRGDLVVAAGGSIEADSVVEAESLTVAGRLIGDMQVSGQVRALAGSEVRGNVRGGAFAIEEGARFAGRIDCDFDLPPELEGGEGRGARRRG